MSNSENTLLLIDGHSLALRSFFGIYTMAEKTGNHVFVRSDGQHTEAVHAFLSTLLNIIKDHNPSHIAVAFDLPGGTFRTEEYSEYKSGRNVIPEAFDGQLDLIKKMLGALKIPALTQENYEADDIVATLTRQGSEAQYKVLILSGDRDIFQLVTDDVTLLYPVTTGPSKGIQRMDPAAVEKKQKYHLGCIRISLRSPVSKPIICLESPELDQALLLNGFTSTVILKVYLLIARTSKVKR